MSIRLRDVWDVFLITMIGAAVCVLVASMGCSSQQKTEDVLLILQEGKAQGHLVITTDGRLSVGQTTAFFAGANAASVSFDGDIDFGDSTRHVSGPDPSDPPG